jgi:hypothetical protein
MPKTILGRFAVRISMSVSMIALVIPNVAFASGGERSNKSESKLIKMLQESRSGDRSGRNRYGHDWGKGRGHHGNGYGHDDDDDDDHGNGHDDDDDDDDGCKMHHKKRGGHHGGGHGHGYGHCPASP